MEELDKLFRLKQEKSKKKIEKVTEQTLIYFLTPLVHNDIALSEKKGWSEFRENLEVAFAPIVGNWRDKKGEKR